MKSIIKGLKLSVEYHLVYIIIHVYQVAYETEL